MLSGMSNSKARKMGWVKEIAAGTRATIYQAEMRGGRMASDAIKAL
jgi:hypothetical protein